MKQQATKDGVDAMTVRDELLHSIKTAVQSIRSRDPSDTQIHCARKALKHARANLRLLRDVVGNTVYRRENVALRNAARPLSRVRDVAVLRATAGQLLRHEEHGARRRLLRKVRRTLKQTRLEARTELYRMNVIKGCIATLLAAKARIRSWRLEPVDRRWVRDGLQRIYRRGREGYELACADPTAENLHEWRKRVKYLYQAMVIWRVHNAARVKGVMKRAHKVASLLGTEHDLGMFNEQLTKLDSAHPVRPAIGCSIAQRQSNLRDKAFNKGRRLFKVKPGAFVRGIIDES